MIESLLTTVSMARELVFKVPPGTSTGEADLVAGGERSSQARTDGQSRSLDHERIDAELVGFWRHAQRHCASVGK